MQKTNYPNLLPYCRHPEVSYEYSLAPKDNEYTYKVCKRCGAVKKVHDDTVTEDVETIYDERIQQWVRAKNCGHMRKVYQQYIVSERWYQKRQECIESARGICEYCGINEAKEVHHRTYTRVFFEEPDDLVAVCVFCHERQHAKNGKKFGN